MFTLPSYFETQIPSFKSTDEYTSFIIDFYIFPMRLRDDENTETYMIGIKFKNCNKTMF